MRKQEAFLLVFSGLAVGFLTGAITFVTVTVPFVFNLGSSAPPQERTQMLTYQNRQFGFQFTHPSSYAVIKSSSPFAETTDYRSPHCGAEIVRFVRQADHSAYVSGGNLVCKMLTI